jgi:hypothetical protein
MATSVRKKTPSSDENNNISDDTGEFQLADFENTAQRNKHLVHVLLKSQAETYKLFSEIHKTMAEISGLMNNSNTAINDMKNMLRDTLSDKKDVLAFRNKLFGLFREPVGNIFYAISKFVTVALLIFAGYLAARYNVALPVLGAQSPVSAGK